MGVYKYDATNDSLIPIAGTSASGIGDKVSTYTADSSYWDTSPTDASTKAITSGGVYDALQGISTADNFIGTLAEWNALSPTEQAEYKTKDIVDDFNGLPIDTTPTQNSVNPVQSGGTYTALANKANESTIAPVQTTLVASQEYKIGAQFFYNGVLYEATALILNGGTITINGNCIASEDIVSQIHKSYQLDNTGINISQYVYPNKYQTPSDGYARLICSVAGTARIVLDDIVMPNYVNAPVNTNLAIFVRKGVPISWVGSTGDTFQFFPVK